MAVDVRTICLALLSRGPKTGYEIKKSFEEGPVGYFIEASFGSIYPALGRLTDEGLVDCRTQAQDGKPDRKIYSLTKAGETAFRASLLVDPAPDRFRSEFLFILQFAEHLPPEHLHKLIEGRLHGYRRALNALETQRCEPLPRGEEFIRGQGVAYLRAIIKHMEDNRHLLEGPTEQLSMRAAE